MSDTRPTDELDRLWSRFSGAVGGPVADSPRAFAASAAVVVMSCALLVAMPGLFVNDKVDDVLIPLDGAWRMAHGQRPHIDFVTPLGDVYYWVLGLAGWLDGADDPHLLAVANVLVALPMLLATWLATRDRLAEPLRALTCVGVSLCALSPRTLDSATLIGFNAMYNRWSWALSFVTLCALVLPVARPRTRASWVLDVGLVALCVLVQFWLKVTFLPLLVAGALIALVLVPENRLGSIGVALGLALAGLSALTPQGSAYLADLRQVAAAAAGGPGLLRIDRLQPVLQLNLSTLALVVPCALALIRTSTPSQERRATRAVMAMVGVAAAGLLVGLQNNDASVPVLGVSLLIAASRFRARGPGPGTALVSLAAAAMLAGTATYDLGSVVLHASLGRTAGGRLHAEGPLARLRIPAPEQVGLSPDGTISQVVSGRIPGDVYDNLAVVPWPADNPVVLDDAVRLLDEHDLRGKRIASLTFSPFFPYLLRAPPPRGLPAWWDWRRTFGPSWDQQACQALADTEVVLAPTVWNITGIREENRPCLEAEFQVLEKSPLWTLWARRTPPRVP